MNSGKTLVTLTLLFVISLFTGSLYFPDTFMMSLADTSTTYQFLRGAIIVLLISLIITTPPRSLMLRGIIGSWSLVLAVLAIEALFSYQVRLLDGLVFLEVAIILALEALEAKQIPVSKKPSPARRIPVVSL